MGRVRENAESIAMNGGADVEVKGIEATMRLVSSVSHRTELEDYHDRKLTLHRNAKGVEMDDGAAIQRKHHLAGLLRKRPRPSPDPASAISN